MRLVLAKPRKHNLYANPKKCDFFKSELEFLGHIICRQGIKVDPKKTAAVQQWPKPQSVTDLRGFLGLANYFRRFIQGYFNIGGPAHLSDWQESVFE